MNPSSKPDNVIIDKLGWASITRRNMELLNISTGDLFYLGIDLDEAGDSFRSLFFIRVKEDENFNELSEVVRFSRRQSRGGFQINSVLRLLEVRPPFICDICIGGDEYYFSFLLPQYKTFKVNEEILTMLKPLSAVLVDDRTWL